MTHHTKGGFLSRKLLFAFCGIAILAVAAFAASGEDKKAETAKQPRDERIRIETAILAPANILDTVTLPGQTEARYDLTLSAEHSGRVETVDFIEGAPVKQGTTIAKIDVSALQAAMQRAQASYDLAQKTASRKTKLRNNKVVSREELDKAETDLRVAESNMREARINYRQGLVISPIDGIINDLHIDPGEYVKEGSPVCNIVDVSTIRINTSVPEMDIRYIKVGDKARITVDAFPEREWYGVVDFVAFKADSGTKTFKARVLVENTDGAIRPGMLARATFLRRSIDNAITVPLNALIDRGGERIVFVEENGVAKSRMIRLGVIDGDRIQILEGLKPGEKLIVTGHTEVEDGTGVISQ